MVYAKLMLAATLVGLVAIFLYYPPPEPSDRLKKWARLGKFYMYKDFRIFYIDFEADLTDDSTVICFHGFPTFSYDWIKIVDRLKEKFGRVILFDFLGYGFSDKPTSHDYLIMEQADIALGLLKFLGVYEVHILSHDYGDTVAQEVLARYNNGEDTQGITLKSLCMLNGGIFPETNYPRPVQKLLAVPYVGEILSRLSFYQIFKRGFIDVFGPSTKPTEEELQDFYAAMRYQDGNKVNSKLIDYIAQRAKNKDRWVGALQKAVVPVHMIYGPSDPVNPPQFVAYYKNTVPNPSIKVLDEAIGHYPQLEAPNEVMNSYAEFIDRLKK
ncbi:hypothetical protein CHS0354_030786 [Potamilus streckersoni]|uniref:AB hydrolase-1 domain-containing protein n=1 Tax=Potamilus streckersoni TaxID=2493646 RepID=A0AAE0TDD3_9BIVA|nr:hypothetical protein CHS0354_030786 [Potamilus streckersoni]